MGREEEDRRGVRTSRSLLAHVVPGRHERVALAEARLRDFREVRSSVEDGPEAAVDVVPRLRGTVARALDRRRDAAARSAAGAGLRRAVVVILSVLRGS